MRRVRRGERREKVTEHDARAFALARREADRPRQSAAVCVREKRQKRLEAGSTRAPASRSGASSPADRQPQATASGRHCGAGRRSRPLACERLEVVEPRRDSARRSAARSSALIASATTDRSLRRHLRNRSAATAAAPTMASATKSVSTTVERRDRRPRPTARRPAAARRGLLRNAGRAERLGREIEVRQRTLEHDGDAIERRPRPASIACACHRDQLLFAIAMGEPGLIGRRVLRREQQPGGPRASSTPSVRGVRFPRDPATSCEAARETRSRASLRCDTMSSCSRPGSRARRSKSATNSPSGSAIQSATVTITCADGLRRAARPCRRVAQHVLVARAGCLDAAVRTRETSRQEPRLRQQPLGAAIAAGILAAERLLDQLLEALDLLRLAAELIVEAQHLGDQPGPDSERQVGRPRGRGARPRACAMASRSKAVRRRGGVGQPRDEARRTARRG